MDLKQDAYEVNIGTQYSTSPTCFDVRVPDGPVLILEMPPLYWI